MTRNRLSLQTPARPRHARRSGFAHDLARVVLSTLVLIASAGCSHDGGGSTQQAAAAPHDVTLTADQRQHLHLYTVAPSTFHKIIDTTGVVDFDNDQATSVLAPFSGPVARILVSAGEKVSQGQPLALVNSPDFAAAVSTYQKAIATARTARRIADLDKDLNQHRGVSQREAEQAQTDAVNAEADREAARQALVSLDVDANVIKAIEEGRPPGRVEGVIRSPIAGTVAEKLITPGQLLQAGSTPCFTVANLSRVWVLANVFGADLAAVRVGDSAEVETGVAPKPFAGKVDNIATVVDPNTRAVAVRIVVDNPDDFLKKQMYVRVRIQAQAQTSGFLVPVSAILRDDENLPFVYVAGPSASFARRHVTLGYRSGDQYDISDGVQAGDQVVVDGGIFVQFMQNQ